MDVKWQVTELPELRAEEEEEPGWQRCRLGKAVEKRKTYNLSKVWFFFFFSCLSCWEVGCGTQRTLLVKRKSGLLWVHNEVSRGESCRIKAFFKITAYRTYIPPECGRWSARRPSGSRAAAGQICNSKKQSHLRLKGSLSLTKAGCCDGGCICHCIFFKKTMHEGTLGQIQDSALLVSALQIRCFYRPRRVDERTKSDRGET